MKKNIVFAFFMILCLNYSLKAQLVLVGKLDNDKAVITLDKGKMISSYNDGLMKASNIDGRFTAVDIIKGYNGEYYLVFAGASWKSVFATTLQDKSFFVDPRLSCTTEDCASEPLGCVPLLTSCTPCKNKGKCTKSISSVAMFE